MQRCCDTVDVQQAGSGVQIMDGVVTLNSRRAMATGNMYAEFGEIWTSGFEMYERTDKERDMQIR